MVTEENILSLLARAFKDILWSIFSSKTGHQFLIKNLFSTFFSFKTYVCIFDITPICKSIVPEDLDPKLLGMYVHSIIKFFLR